MPFHNVVCLFPTSPITPQDTVSHVCRNSLKFLRAGREKISDIPVDTIIHVINTSLSLDFEIIGRIFPLIMALFLFFCHFRRMHLQRVSARHSPNKPTKVVGVNTPYKLRPITRNTRLETIAVSVGCSCKTLNPAQRMNSWRSPEYEHLTYDDNSTPNSN